MKSCYHSLDLEPSILNWKRNCLHASLGLEEALDSKIPRPECSGRESRDVEAWL